MANTSESLARAHIRRESLDVYNRLHSIQADIAFVNQVRAAYPSFPLIPNLRCGAWYTDPAIAHPTAQAYFKSTDGHHGNWAFNLRRPNIHLLPVAATHGGLILVDSTRAGKRLPDALSKTVPIWCAVINRATCLRGSVEVEDLDLCTSPGAVSPHEHAQIATRLDSWAATLAGSSYALPELAKPLRPLWITPASTRFPYVAPDAPFLPVICVSASCAVDAGTERRMGGFSYVQGSGDDHELWGQGLTPQLFWKHRAELLACSRGELDAVVLKLVAAAREMEQAQALGRDDSGLRGTWSALPTPVLKVGGRVLLCTLTDLPWELLAGVQAPGTCEPDNDDGETAFIIIVVAHALNATPPPPIDTDKTQPKEPRSHDGNGTRPSAAAALGESEGGGATSRVLRLYLPSGRRARQHVFVHEVLPRAVSFASSHLGLGRKICVAGGGDESVGVALVLLQSFFDDDGGLLRGDDGDTSGGAAAARKSSVRTRLEWIIASRAQVNPSRTILKRVNDFLLSPHSHRRQDGVE